jgi:hypothetical protein
MSDQHVFWWMFSILVAFIAGRWLARKEIQSLRNRLRHERKRQSEMHVERNGCQWFD